MEEIRPPSEPISPSEEQAVLQAVKVSLPVKPTTHQPPGNQPPRRRKSRRHIELARRRQMTYLQRRREQKKLRVVYGRIRACLRVCFASLLLYLIVCFLKSGWWMFHEPNFSLQGSKLLTEANIQPYVLPYKNKPVYLIDPDTLAGQLKHRFGIIDQIYVRRYLFPARLEFKILEKTPWAILYDTAEATEPYGMVGNDFHRFSIVPYHYDPAAYSNHPPLKLILSAAPVKTALIKKLYEIGYQLKSVPGLHLLSLDASNPDDMKAHFAEAGIRLGRFDMTIESRLLRLWSIAPQLPALKNKIDWVDLRWNQEVTLHKKVATKPDGTEQSTTTTETPALKQPTDPAANPVESPVSQPTH